MGWVSRRGTDTEPHAASRRRQLRVKQSTNPQHRSAPGWSQAGASRLDRHTAVSMASQSFVLQHVDVHVMLYAAPFLFVPPLSLCSRTHSHVRATHTRAHVHMHVLVKSLARSSTPARD